MLDVSGRTQLVPDLAGLRRGQVLGGGSIALSVGGKARLSPIVVDAGATLRADGASGTLDVDTRTGFGIVTAPTEIASDGGAITIAAREGGALLHGSLSALAGGRPAAAGRFSLDLGGRSRSDTPLPGDVDAFVVRVQNSTDAAEAATPGTVVVSANTLQRNFADATLASMDRIDIAAGTRLAMARSLQLDAPVLAVDGTRGGVTVSAASTLRVGNAHAADATGRVPAATGGGGSLTLQSGLVELFGEQSLRNIGSVQVRAGSEMRVDGVLRDGVHSGALHAQADLAITTPQLSPTSGTRYLLDAGSGTVKIGGGDPAAVAPAVGQR